MIQFTVYYANQNITKVNIWGTPTTSKQLCPKVRADYVVYIRLFKEYGRFLLSEVYI